MVGVISFKLFAFFALCWPGLAGDARLDALRSSLIGTRGRAPESGGPRGANPQLTIAKHELRDWVESRLAAYPQRGDEGELEKRLNSEIREAGLTCDYQRSSQQPQCPDWYLSGFLGVLAVRRSAGFLIVQTGVGIECGYDESAYVYSWAGEKWARVWQNEQNTYTENEYTPQTLHAVLISPYNKANDYIVLTLGSESWCASNWHRVYYRAFRLGPDLQAGPLVQGSDWAYLGKHYPPILGSVTANDVLVEYTLGSIDGGVHSREAIRHYTIEHGKVKRIEPLALSPRDFVDEWLITDWKSTAFWSESANRGPMRAWHTKLHQHLFFGQFIYPTMHCAKMPDLWQVGVDFSDPPPIGAPPKGTYFLVRWQPPYQFTMVNVGDHPRPGCAEEDPKADDEHHTLFPIQEWR